MERLTEKLDQPCYVDLYDVRLNLYEPKNFSTDTEIGACIDKLGQLEDIEQELGVDLIKLCKSFEEDIYIKPDDKIIFVRYDDKEFVFYEGNLICKTDKGNFTVSIDDYGKTWALTREELK